MYHFHCNFIKINFDAELLFTDRDSVTYEIKSEDVYEEFFKHKHLFDFSNFSKDSKFYDSQYKMVVGKMKVEHKGIPIKEFVGLKSKMDLMFSDDGKESIIVKGINTATEFNEFKDTLFDKKVTRHKAKNIKLEHTKSAKHHYCVLMIKDLFQMMGFIH